MHVYVCLGLLMHRTFWKKELTVVIYGKKKWGGRVSFTTCIPSHLLKLRIFAMKS